MLTVFTCYGQQINEISISGRNRITTDDLWNFSVINSLESRLNVIFEIRLSDIEAAEIYKSTSPVVELLPGITDIAVYKLSGYQQQFFSSSLKKAISNSGYLPEGSYNICIYVFSAADKTEISNRCTEITLINPEKLSQDVVPAKPLQLNGQVQISGFFTDYMPLNSELSPGNLQMNSRMEFSAYGVPLSSLLLLSTEQNSARQNINKFNIEFNSAEFVRQLKQKLTDKIKIEQNIINAGNLDRLRLTNELNAINAKLENPQVKAELEKIEQLRQMRRKLESATDSSEINQLKQSISKYDELQQKEKGYERIIQRKKEIGLLPENKLTGNKISDALDLNKADDPQFLLKKLSDYHLTTRSTKYLMWVRKFQLGTSIPDLSSLSCRNTPLNGFFTELQPGLFYVSFMYGNIRSTAISRLSDQLSFKRRAVAGGLGIGRKESSHLHLYALSFEDDTNSVRQTDTFAYYRLNPASNKVLSADLQINLFKNNLIFRAELAGTQLIRNKFLYDKKEVMLDSQHIKGFMDADQWFYNIITQRHNSLYAAVDYACKAGLMVNVNKTASSVNFDLERTGKNFETFGLPYLRKDVLRYSVTFNQAFLKKKITVKAFLRLDDFNREQSVSPGSEYWFYGTDISVRFPRMPYFRLLIAPVTQISDSVLFDLNNYTLSGGYSYQIGKSQLFSSLILNRQETVKGASGFNFNSTNISCIQNIGFGRAFSLSLNLSYNEFSINDSAANYSNIGIVGSYNIKKIQGQLGVNTILYQSLQNKLGMYFQISVPFSSYLQFMARIERNVYDNPLKSELMPDYEQWMVRGNVSVKF